MNKKRIFSILTAIVILISLVTVAFATGEAVPSETGEPLPWYAGLLGSGFLPIIVMVLVFYFFFIRPESKRKKETKNMRDNLKVGDKITTIGGITGRITNVRDDEITLETGGNDKSKLRFKKWAVSSVDKKKEEDPAVEVEE